jgi:hypothetical protein
VCPTAAVEQHAASGSVVRRMFFLQASSPIVCKNDGFCYRSKDRLWSVAFLPSRAHCARTVHSTPKESGAVNRKKDQDILDGVDPTATGCAV